MIILRTNPGFIPNTEGKINRLYYEITLLKLLRRELRCKNIWVQGAFKYADPEKDLPQDFTKNKSQHCQMLNLSEDPQQEIAKLKREMLDSLSLSLFNTSIVTDPPLGILLENWLMQPFLLETRRYGKNSLIALPLIRHNLLHGMRI